MAHNSPENGPKLGGPESGCPELGGPKSGGPEPGCKNQAWLPPPGDCYDTLGPTTLDLWRIPLDRPVQMDTLSDDEVARFKRYRFAADQRKFAVARSSLRQILAHYSHQLPASLAFDYGFRGKPQLRHHGWLQFNLSHSGEYALCAVARQVVGVDIEQLRPMDRLDGLIHRCLAMTEQQAIEQINPDHQSTAFLKYWTCKEAYLKATGQGISESLAAIEVELTPIPRLRVPDPAPDSASAPGPHQPWQLQVFVPDVGYTAAAVMSPEINHIRLWAYETMVATL
ncbi:4'-phosphopantetheinyl transferase family protein [Leptothoe sp. PORK10 BA2]|uniref:4'-phosphopantetheinyl transferase family protein n=1 Tax=Leptothoe sp. PORK10 BA2 TaxID=3110254 RepID=UPI002B20A9BE|nr:4'-phosphopantetheinyl transferase superfamily protein [Leptothoe sp. PORK10 BA2]MEA5466655.1 4'-phosphopantetheinyl transferase superfamily protein [Leptothoe sp. PORK10 BA2]